MRALVAMALMFALSFPAAAEACVPSTSTATLDAAGWYLVADDCLEASEATIDEEGEVPIFSPWDQEVVDMGHGCPTQTYGELTVSVLLYIEVNDIVGLQRGDIVHDDTCRGAIEPDTIYWWALF